MTELDRTTQFDALIRPGFFGASNYREIIADMRLATESRATVYGQSSSGSIDERIRKAARQTPSPATVDYVRRRLWECKHEIEQHFDVSLGECEEPQFLRYDVGDFFVAHQDGNTGLLRLDTEARRVSIVIFLNPQSGVPKEGTYCGGSLVLHDLRGGDRKRDFAPASGTFIAFRSETTHEVTPITDGQRYSIACWYR